MISGDCVRSVRTLIIGELANVDLDGNQGGEDMAGQETTPRAGSAPEWSRGQLREVAWVRVSILIFSSDGHLLMSQTDPKQRKNHLHAWHFPCGEVQEGESLEEAAVRLTDEKAGLRLAPEQFVLVPFVGEDEAVKTLSTGETVWSHVKLKRFEVRLNRTAHQLEAETLPGRDLVVLRFFRPQDLVDIELVPGIREFLIRAGYIKPKNAR